MLNQVNIQGRISQPLELKTTPNGVSVITFTLAVERNYKNGNERQADFINCVAWRNTAEFISKYFDKGRMMIASGELQTRTYDAQDGSKRYVTEVLVNNAYFAGDKATTPQEQIQQAMSGDIGNGFTAMEDEEPLPF